MKRCPACKSVSQDKDVICDACGASIANVPFETMDEIDRDQMLEEKQETELEQRQVQKAKARTIVGVMMGLVLAAGVIIAGALLIGQGDYLGVFVIMVGFAIIAGVLGTGPFTRASGGRF